MWRRRAVGGIQTAALLVGLTACGGTPAPRLTEHSPQATAGVTQPTRNSPPSGTYASARLPYSFDIPTGWQPGAGEEGAGGRIIESWFSDAGTITVGSTELPAGTEPAAFVQELIEGRTECTSDDVPVLESTLGGEPAFRFQYSCGPTHFAADIATYHSGRRYVVTVETDDHETSVQTLDAVITTFSFSDAP